jgi:hypothetical protein
MDTTVAAQDPGSFRDPSGFVYRRTGVVYRQINRSFADEWDRLVASGLLDQLQARGWLVNHETVASDQALDPVSAHAVIRPDAIPFISYPYEWCFGQLKTAALQTLEIQQLANAAGFTLRDASAYNIQFLGAKPVLIDSLSFAPLRSGAPWLAYRQFCEHFLAPLALMAYRDVRLGMLSRQFVDGLPLDLASRLLPRRTLLRLGLLSHIHLHAGAQRRFGADGVDARGRRDQRIGDTARAALLDSLLRVVRGLRWQPAGTEWADYAENTSYGSQGEAAKDEIVRDLLDHSGGGVVWDLGANTGRYSRIAADRGHPVIAWDLDHGATERHFDRLRRDGRNDILPLIQDLANPSPGIGWAGVERASLFARANARIIMALALVHHLAIGRNVPLGRIAETLASLGPELIVEFVPKEDPMVRRMLSTRDDVFADYAVDGFRRAFSRAFDIAGERPVPGTSRIIYRMVRRA